MTMTLVLHATDILTTQQKTTHEAFTTRNVLGFDLIKDTALAAFGGSAMTGVAQGNIGVSGAADPPCIPTVVSSSSSRKTLSGLPLGFLGKWYGLRTSPGDMCRSYALSGVPTITLVRPGEVR